MYSIKLFHTTNKNKIHYFILKEYSLQLNKYFIILNQQARQASRRSSNRWAF